MPIDTPGARRYDLRMDLKNLEKLEGLVASLAEELRRLKAENKTLLKDLEKQKKEVEKVFKDQEKSKKQLDLMARLEKDKKKLESGQSQVREKVENILEELEKIDFL